MSSENSACWSEFKARTELRWQQAKLRPELYGFQIAPNTRWNPGLSHSEIKQIEDAFGISLPTDFADLLRYVNGLDRPCVNTHGGSGRAPDEAIRSYSYPRDLRRAKDWLTAFRSEQATVRSVLQGSGFAAPPTGFIPFYAHRVIVAFDDPRLSPVLSAMGSDVIVYGNDLPSYLKREFLND